MASRENVLSRGKCGRAGNFDLQQGKRGEPCEVPEPSRDSVPGRTRGRATTSTESWHLSGYKAVSSGKAAALSSHSTPCTTLLGVHSTPPLTQFRL